MKQPLFVYEGKSYPVSLIHFNDDGSLSNIYFVNDELKGVTVFQKSHGDSDKYNFLHADLYKCLQQQK